MTIADKIREAVARLHARQSYIPTAHKVRRAFENPNPPSEADDFGLRQSLASIADRTFCEGVKFSDQQLRADRRAAHPDIVEFGRLLVKRLRRLNVPMYEHCMWRTMADQQAAYVLGHSKAKPGESPHNFGCAVDIVHGIRQWNLSKSQWSIVGHVGRELAAQKGFKLTWGGDWRFYDPAHWELTDWPAHKITREDG
ncbi:MAG: M15 family metallopeptidase [Mesorhizobium sp.]|uniref:M15 family metallopeptidase n=1 Tax=Mesorhizobium sp. TaxID=1871066 RepID=UPI0011F727A4|nr:M15 family metallopeptidase [Mesorhizobium sp.]TIM42883.1 MAG: M15 family metallopeptidase [Mesorhizobium sp.]